MSKYMVVRRTAFGAERVIYCGIGSLQARYLAWYRNILMPHRPYEAREMPTE